LSASNKEHAHREIFPELEEANLFGVNLNRGDLILADLKRANLSFASLSGANLSGADLSGANLSGANLSFADFGAANLSKADLSRANLVRADFGEANLSGADLSKVDLSKVDLSKANLSGATIGRTIFGDVDLRTVRGLETVSHRSPSTIGTDTILRSEGNIPEIFLRGAGLTDTFIAYARSLTQHPIEYSTCFMSYSSKNQDFAERLYTDLQHKGVRCWFAPEDMKTGDKIRYRIDESIRLFDKLLLVLSEHSIASTWVEHEVEMALAKEQKVKRTVLFPIRLDTAIMDMDQDGWPAEVRHTRHITDFTHWKQHDEYQKALTRLLRDLQPDMAPEKAQ